MQGQPVTDNKMRRTWILIGGLTVFVIGVLVGRFSAPDNRSSIESTNNPGTERNESTEKKKIQDEVAPAEFTTQSKRLSARRENGTVIFTVKKVIPRPLPDGSGTVPETLIGAFVSSPTHRLDVKISPDQSEVTFTLPESAIKGLRLLAKINIDGHPDNGHNIHRMLDLESVIELPRSEEVASEKRGD